MTPSINTSAAQWLLGPVQTLCPNTRGGERACLIFAVSAISVGVIGLFVKHNMLPKGDTQAHKQIDETLKHRAWSYLGHAGGLLVATWPFINKITGLALTGLGLCPATTWFKTGCKNGNFS